MLRLLCLSFLIICSFANAEASAIKDNADKKFDNYVEGAMQVYVQFKQPSKDESEQFYAFVKSKWVTTPCKDDCTTWGYNAGKEYATRKNLELENKKPVYK